MAWLKRAIRNWLGVSGDSSYPHRIVAMCYFRDDLIVVDGNGDIYKMNADIYDPRIDGFVIELMQKNPLERN